VVTAVTEIASGLNDERAKLKKLLTDAHVGEIIVEHRGGRVEVVFPTDTGDELVDDFVTIITSVATRLYGRRNAKKWAVQIQARVKQGSEHLNKRMKHEYDPARPQDRA
jgi:predicted site-specific integrase-resolvase